MPKLPSQYEAYTRRSLNLGGPIDASNMDTVPIYSRAFFLGGSVKVYAEVVIFLDTTSTVETVQVGMVYSNDKTTAGADCVTIVRPFTVADPVAGVNPQHLGVPGKQEVYIPQVKSGDRTERFAFVFTTGDYASRYQFGRMEAYATGGAGTSHTDDTVQFILLNYGDEVSVPIDTKILDGWIRWNEGDDIDP